LRGLEYVSWRMKVWRILSIRQIRQTLATPNFHRLQYPHVVLNFILCNGIIRSLCVAVCYHSVNYYNTTKDTKQECEQLFMNINDFTATVMC